MAAQRILQCEYPELTFTISEVKDWANIEQYTSILSAASLVVDGKLVCVGRIPSRQEVLEWIRSTITD